MTEMPFGFLWCYEPNDDEEQCGVLLIGDPEEVPPLQIVISNILSNKTITINSIEGVTQADSDNYHFKLQFNPGILADSQQISVESENWEISPVADAQEDSLYLLWTGASIALSQNEATEILLTGVAAQSIEKLSTTDVTISWQLNKEGIDFIDIGKIPGEGGDYDENTTLELTMTQATGKSNIPLYVGLVNCNKVLNIYQQTSNLQLRITNKNLPGDNSEITFHYDNDLANCSQLTLTLEVGDVASVPWALATKDLVQDIAISVGSSDQWQQNGEIAEIKVGETVKALQWTFAPASADVVLAAQETMLINLNGIITNHPTGETNLYLGYQYVPGYKDGQFICQIEKAPLVFDEKVRMGTKKELDGLLCVTNGISIDSPGEIQHTGPLVFRSDSDKGDDDNSVVFYKQDETKPLMALKSCRQLKIFGINSSTEIGTAKILELRRPSVKNVKNAHTVSFEMGAFKPGAAQGTQFDIALSSNRMSDNQGGEYADQTVLSLFADGEEINGEFSPKVTLKAQGRIQDKTGYIMPVGTVVPYVGLSAPTGWFFCLGQNFDQDKYPELYEVLRSSTLPNLKDRFIVGAGQNYNVADTGGASRVTLNISQMPSHNHDSGDFSKLLKSDGLYTTDGSKLDSTSGEPNLIATGGIVPKGGDQSHENKPPYYALNYIIKA